MLRPIRLGAVTYLNARPLVYGLQADTRRFSIRFDVPSTCAALLHERSVEVGLIPSIEYLHRPDYHIVPDVADALRGHVFVAHNAGFDWRFVTTEIERATGERMEGRRLCTVKMARRLVPQLSRRSLDHLARFFGIENTARHRAGGDAVATAKVFIRMLKEAHGRGCETWQELEALLRIPSRGRRRRRRAMPHYMDRDTTA